MPLTARLLVLPPWLVLLIINTIFIAGSLILLFFARHLISPQVREKHHGVTSAIFSRAVSMFGILLAFVVIILWQEYQAADVNAINEGNAALDIYRDLSHYPNSSQVEAATSSYSKFIISVVQDEYPAMKQMMRSKKTQKTKDNLWLDIMNIQPKTSQEQTFYKNIVKNFESLSNYRRTRLKELHSSVPDVLWVVIIIGSIVTIFSATLLFSEKLWIHALSISMLAIIVATTIFLAIQLDYPFMGALSAEKAGYTGILKMIGGQSTN